MWSLNLLLIIKQHNYGQGHFKILLLIFHVFDLGSYITVFVIYWFQEHTLFSSWVIINSNMIISTVIVLNHVHAYFASHVS